MWMQRWLGDAYSSLYSEFGRDTFSLQDAQRVVNLKESNLHVALSLLHRAGAVIVFDRGRPRAYRLLDPRSLVLRTSGKIAHVDFPQEAYLQLIYDTLRALRDRVKLTSFCVFGSVARGEAKRTSDVDILVVSDSFKGSVASRIDSLSFVDEMVKGEVRFLGEHGYRTAPNLLPLRREEAERVPVLFLDPAVNAKMLFDEGGFMTGILTRLRARLDLAGSKRVETEHGWYWDLKPDYTRGEKEVLI
jgi:predicted nucleotidyltransferase